MPSASERDAAMGHIADLARRAVDEPNLPPPVRSYLQEILRLAGPQTGDTPEPSDVPQTENQSL